MTKKAWKTINRRSYLRGTGGLALALPFLEYFTGSARAQSSNATRLIVCYAGQAMGGDGDNSQHRFKPELTGKLIDMPSLPLSLQPLGGRELWLGEYMHPRHGSFVEPIRNWPGEVADVREHVSVVTGLRVPGNSGPAHADTFAHRGSVSAVLSGTSGSGKSAKCNGPTADVLAQEQFGSEPTLHCLVQAGNYGNQGSEDPVMSWRREGGQMRPNHGQVSPRTMYNALFEGFVPPQDQDMQSEAEALESARRTLRRRTVLDLVLPSAQELHQRLGMEDRQRLEAHMDGIRTLRDRVGNLEGALDSCHVPENPGEDPPYAGGRGGERGGMGHDVGEGWSQEEKRAEAFIDMLTTAMACNMTRTGNIMFSYTQSFINAEDATGLRGDQHAIGHGGNVERANGSANDSVALCHHYPVRYFGYLVHRLAQFTSGPGRTLLDDIAAGLFFEQGHGGDGRKTAHSGEDMSALIAGGAGGLLRGHHVDAAGDHPARVLASLLKATGCEARLGELSGEIPGLFT